MLELSNKDFKAIYDFNQITKNVFSHYYLRYNGDAAAPMLYQKAEDALSFTRTDLPIYEFFTLLGLTPDNVLFVDGVALYKALNKKTMVQYCYINEGNLFIVTSNLDANKNGSWIVSKDMVHVLVAKIVSVDECSKSFDLSVDLRQIEHTFHDITDEVETIMDKEMVALSHNGFSTVMCKPLLPGISKKTNLSMSFQRYKEGHFKAHFRLEKEQVFNYHTYIAYTIFS